AQRRSSLAARRRSMATASPSRDLTFDVDRGSGGTAVRAGSASIAPEQRSKEGTNAARTVCRLLGLFRLAVRAASEPTAWVPRPDGRSPPGLETGRASRRLYASPPLAGAPRRLRARTRRPGRRASDHRR